MSKQKFIVEFSASVGRKKENIADEDPGASLHSPIELKFFAVTEAMSVEDATSKIVQYGDPGFKVTVVSIKELGDHISSGELMKLMPLDKIITDIN